MNERLTDIARRFGFTDIPKGEPDFARQFYEHTPENNWLRRILADPGLSLPHQAYKQSQNLSVRYLDAANRRIQEFLTKGFSIVFLSSNSYQVLEPSIQSLIRFSKDEFATKRFPQHVPAIHGLSGAFLESAPGTKDTYFSVSCGNIGTTTHFDRFDPDNSPILYAVSPASDSSTAVLIVGHNDNSQFIHSVAA